MKWVNIENVSHVVVDERVRLPNGLRIMRRTACGALTVLPCTDDPCAETCRLCSEAPSPDEAA